MFIFRFCRSYCSYNFYFFLNAMEFMRYYASFSLCSLANNIPASTIMFIIMCSCNMVAFQCVYFFFTSWTLFNVHSSSPTFQSLCLLLLKMLKYKEDCSCEAQQYVFLLLLLGSFC